ncbi:MAG: TIGR00282 family metallophosphoesterase [Nitrospinae bacterium]|nr:TIGR00282 family metallophosphoesterase [Nitrospinota bacterium]
MKILVIGDVFGRTGRRMLKTGLANIVNLMKADFVIANCENLAGGFGFTKEMLEEVYAAGVEAVTTGNHVWDKKEALDIAKVDARVLRPANYPEGVPGRGSAVFTTRGGKKVGILNVMGRVFMDALDCPFKAAERELEKLKAETNIVIVDAHCEATSEKQALGYFLDGRVSAVLGTHTHVQTADEKIMSRGTAFITDVGMTGPAHSIIGVRVDIILKRFLQKLPERFEEAHGPGQLNAVLVEVDDLTGLAKNIKRVQTAEPEN